MTNADTELLRVAHHEAGHAVAGFALGRGFKRVSTILDPEQESAGHVTARGIRIAREREYRSPTTLRERQQLLDEIVFRFAGAQAESRFRGVELSQVLKEGTAEHDYEPIEFFGGDLEPSPKPRTALFEYLQARAADIVELHWYLIEALAAELVTHRTLSGPSVHRLLRVTILEQPEARDLGVSPDATRRSVRGAADWIGHAKRGWDDD